MASSEARELDLVKKVELRIALTEADPKLETLLGTYLTPLLLKLNSEHASVRQKVISVCQHLNVRLQSQTIKLPVEALLKQAKTNRNSSLLRNFDLTFIQKGLQRLNGEQRAKLLPDAIRGLSEDFTLSPDFGSEIFNIILRLLVDFSIPLRGNAEDVELRKKFDVPEKDLSFVATWFGKLFLVNRVRTSNNESDNPPPCPGLTPSEVRFLTLFGKRDAFDPMSSGGMNLTAIKIKAAKLLVSGLFDDHERFRPALCAASNSNSDISVLGEDMLKRATASADLEHEATIKQLFELYSQERATSSMAMPPIPLRIRVLSLLSKSTLVIRSPQMLLAVVSNGLFPRSGGLVLTSKELARLRSATITFFTSVVRMSQATSQPLDVDRFIYNFLSVLQLQQWPKPAPGADIGLRQQIYEVIGSAVVMSKTLECRLIVLEFLFDSLTLDASGEETGLCVQEALLTMMRTFELNKTDEKLRDRLTELLLRHSQPGGQEVLNVEQIETRLEDFKRAAGLKDSDDMELDESDEVQEQLFTPIRSSQYIALRYANRCLPYADPTARWIDVLAIGSGKRPEVIDEGRKGLNAHWFRSMNADILNSSTLATATFMPALTQFVSATKQQLLQSCPPSSVGGSKDSMDVDGRRETLDSSSFVSILQTYCTGALTPYTSYLRQLLLYEALRKRDLAPDLDKDEWARTLDASLQSSRQARLAVTEYLRTWDRESSETIDVSGYYICLAATVSLQDKHDSTLNVAEIYTELLTLAPDSLLPKLLSYGDLSRVHSVALSNNRVQRESAAHAYGLLLSSALHIKPQGNVAESKLQDLLNKAKSWKTAVGSEINQVIGSILAMGYALSRMAYRDDTALLDQFLKSYIEILVNVAKASSDKTLLDSAVASLGQLAAYKAVTSAQLASELSVADLIEKVADFAKKGNERAILCLGQFSIILDPVQNAKNMERLEETLYALHEIKETEAQFAVGEALSILTCGWESTALAPKHDVDGPLPTTPDRADVVSRVLDHVIHESKASKPSLRRSAVIWLLSLVQFCGHRQEVQERLRDCQRAFKGLLSDKSELVQEAASRGLGLVYEKGDRGLRDDLVRDLIGSFTDNKAQLAGKVTADTELFDEGALPTGDGSVTTYKDILSLASEVGNPSLVYRFMSLAANNSIWSSRAAFGRFGLSTVLSDSSVDGYLSENPKLYPKLYRYRFDPNPNVRRSMNDIWNALVKDTSGTIDRCFGAIIEDLLTSMLGREWRVRQASCDATADLVQGRPFEKVEPYLSRIWEQCFKVLDDIKGSVREAAATLARTMTGILIRSLEAGEGSAKKADGMLKHVVPFLLSAQGLESSAKEVMAFAITTLLDIIKKSSGKVLRPYIPGLVERFLALFSSLESQIAEYLRMNASKYEVSETDIDDARVMAVRQSPLMEATERCLDLLDDQTMETLAPKLENAIKTVIGLPSQVACSRILVSLSTRHNQLFRPYANRFLKLAQRHFTDRNETVSVAYAQAAGYVSRVATDEGVLDLVEKTKKLYFTSDDDKHRLVAGDVMHAMAKHASDRFSSLASDALPFVYLGKHDSITGVKDTFQKTWDESVGGSRSVHLYLKEILNLVNDYLSSPKWVLKHSSARTVADTVEALAVGNEDISLANAEVVWPVLVQAMSGKTWEGKEVVLEAFVKFVEKGGRLWKEKDSVASEITKIITREAKRQNISYRPFAIRGIGQIAAARTDIDMIGTVFDIVTPLINELSVDSSDAMDVDEPNETKMTSDLREKTLANAIDAMAKCLREGLLASKQSIEKLQSFTALSTKANSSLHARLIAAATYDAVKSLAPKLSRNLLEQLNQQEIDIQARLLELLSLEHFPSAPEAFRLKRAQAAAALATAPWNEQSTAQIRSKLKQDSEAEPSSMVKQALLQDKR